TTLPFVTVVLTDSQRKSAAGSIMLAMTSWTPAIGFSGEGAGAGALAGPDCAATIVSCFGPQPVSKAPSTAAHAAIIPNRLPPILLTSKSLTPWRRAWYTRRSSQPTRLRVSAALAGSLPLVNAAERFELPPVASSWQPARKPHVNARRASAGHNA